MADDFTFARLMGGTGGGSGMDDQVEFTADRATDDLLKIILNECIENICASVHTAPRTTFMGGAIDVNALKNDLDNQASARGSARGSARANLSARAQAAAKGSDGMFSILSKFDATKLSDEHGVPEHEDGPNELDGRPLPPLPEVDKDAFFCTVCHKSAHCFICNLSFSSEVQHREHNEGRKHKQMVQARADAGQLNVPPVVEKPFVCTVCRRNFFCEICSKPFCSQMQMDDHLSGRKHKKLAAKVMGSAGPAGKRVGGDRPAAGVQGGVPMTTAPRYPRYANNGGYYSAASNGGAYYPTTYPSVFPEANGDQPTDQKAADATAQGADGAKADGAASPSQGAAAAGYDGQRGGYQRQNGYNNGAGGRGGYNAGGRGGRGGRGGYQGAGYGSPNGRGGKRREFDGRGQYQGQANGQYYMYPSSPSYVPYVVDGNVVYPDQGLSSTPYATAYPVYYSSYPTMYPAGTEASSAASVAAVTPAGFTPVAPHPPPPEPQRETPFSNLPLSPEPPVAAYPTVFPMSPPPVNIRKFRPKNQLSATSPTFSPHVVGSTVGSAPSASAPVSSSDGGSSPAAPSVLSTLTGANAAAKA